MICYVISFGDSVLILRKVAIWKTRLKKAIPSEGQVDWGGGRWPAGEGHTLTLKCQPLGSGTFLPRLWDGTLCPRSGLGFPKAHKCLSRPRAPLCLSCRPGSCGIACLLASLLWSGSLRKSEPTRNHCPHLPASMALSGNHQGSEVFDSLSNSPARKGS